MTFNFCFFFTFAVFEDCKEDHEGVIRRFICYQYGIRKQILQDHFAYGFSMLINVMALCTL